MKFPMLCRSLIALAPLVAGPSLVRAQESAGTSAYRDSIAQDELRADTQRVRQDLEILLDELQQSQGATAERLQIQDALQKLGTLSEQDMAAVVQALRDAGGQDNAAGVQDKLLSASQGQKNIQVLLRTLSDRFARQRTQAAMQARLQSLVLRQTANLRETTTTTAEVQAHGLSYGPKQSAVALGAEENAIKQELVQAMAALQQTAANPTAASDARGAAAALKEATTRQLPGLAATATTNTLGLMFPEAVAAQRAVLDGMEAMLVRMDSTQEMQDCLQQISAQVRDLSSEQKQLAESSRADFARGTENAARQDLRERQQHLGDRTTALHAEIAALNADAAGQLRDAGTSMDGATGILQQHWDALRNSSVPQMRKDGTPIPLNFHASLVKNQDEAADKLDALGATLQKQADALAAAAPDAPPDPAQTLASLQELSEKVDKALDTQKGLNAKPDEPDAAARQKQLADATTDLQKRVQTVSPPAAANLGQAADEMRQAAPPVNKPASSGTPPSAAPRPAAAAAAAAQQAAKAEPASPPAAPTTHPAAQKAADQLAQASTALHEQVQKLQDAIAAEKRLDEMMSQLNTTRDQTTQASEAMQQSPADADKHTEDAEKSLQQVQNDAQNDAVVPTEAKEDMQHAAEHLAQSKAHSAEPQHQQAKDANHHAQESLDHAMQNLQQAKDAALAAAMPQGMPQLAQNSEKYQPGGKPQGQPKSGPDSKSTGLLDIKPAGDGGPVQLVGGLKPKDRDAIRLLEKEAPPAEYSSMVGQYTKNLSDGDSPETELP